RAAHSVGDLGRRSHELPRPASFPSGLVDRPRGPGGHYLGVPTMSSFVFARRCFSLFVLAPAALAGTLVVPHGFNVETHADVGPLMLPLPDGGALLSTGSFGAA